MGKRYPGTPGQTGLDSADDHRTAQLTLYPGTLGPAMARRAREHVTNQLPDLFRRLAAMARLPHSLARRLSAVGRRYHTVRAPSTRLFRTFTPQRRQDIGRDPLHDRELFLVRRFHQELAHAGLAVTADDVGEGIG